MPKWEDEIAVKYIKDPVMFYADRLYHAMKGLGTDDKTLIRIIICRSEVTIFFKVFLPYISLHQIRNSNKKVRNLKADILVTWKGLS